MIRKVKLQILLLLISILVVQLILTGIQKSRYHFEVDANDNYACVQMSRDCELFFEMLDFKVMQVKGTIYNYNGTERGTAQAAHRWIMLDFGLINIPFESTALLFLNPTWLDKYENIQTSEGYIVDGEYQKKLSWS